MAIKKVCVIGGGLMGRQIGLNTALYDFEVTVTDANAQVCENAAKWAEDYLAGRIAKGKMDEARVAEIKSRFRVVDSLEEAAKDADLVIEAIIEDEGIKKDLFKRLCTIVREDTIIATNSSRMVSSIFVDCVSNPGRLLNLHYFNPALVMKLTEVVKGAHVSDETVAAVMQFSRDTGKIPVLIQKEIDGFIANRILGAISDEAFFLVENGYCTYEEVDLACENALNHPMGPYRLLDFSGIDLVYMQLHRAYEISGEKPRGYDILKEKYENNEWGQKSGKGFYDWSKK